MTLEVGQRVYICNLFSKRYQEPCIVVDKPDQWVHVAFMDGTTSVVLRSSLATDKPVERWRKERMNWG